jgi:hypothetical protein
MAFSLVAITPHPADALADCYGVNTHLGKASTTVVGSTTYHNVFDQSQTGHSATQIATAIANSKVRHIRDTYGGATSGDNSQFDKGIAACAAAGITYMFGLIPHGSGSTLSARLTALQSSGYTPDAVETYNEWNGNGGGSQSGSPPGWITDLITGQSSLWSAKASLGNPVILGPPLISATNASIPWPTVVTDGWDTTKLDVGNIHIYTLNASTGGAFHPEHATFGFPAYVGSNALASKPSGPTWVTETGNPNMDTVEVPSRVDSCTFTSGSATVSDPSIQANDDTTPAKAVTCAGFIPSGTTISTVNAGTQKFTMSQNATASGTANATLSGNMSGFMTPTSAAKFNVRAGLWGLLNGIARTYLYEAFHEYGFPATAGGEDRYGAIGYADLTATVGSVVLARIIGLMSDPGSNPAPAPELIAVQYNGTNNLYQSGTSNLYWDLYRFRNGDLMFVSWLGVASWATPAGAGFVGPGMPCGADTPANPQAVTVALGTSYGATTVYRPFIQSAPVYGMVGGSTFSFLPTDDPVFVRFSARQQGRARWMPFPGVAVPAA